MAALLSIGIWTVLALTCIGLFLLAVVIWLAVALFDRQRRINHLFSCFWAHLVLTLNPAWRVRVTGRKLIDRGKAFVLVANHSSLADIALSFLLYRQFKWVSKASVFKVPVLGWNMRMCRYVPLTRRDPESITKMMKTCRRWLQQGMSVMMFPEGTRSHNGEVKPFKHGAFTLALETGVPVIPIAIHGARDVIPKHGQKLASKACPHVEVLPPIAPDAFADAGAFGEAVRQRIRQALGQ